MINHAVKRIVLAHLLLFLLGVCAYSVESAQSSANHHERWVSEIAKFEKEDASRLPAANGIVFVGSSTIRLWPVQKSFPGMPILNRGFGGSILSDSVYFAPRIILKYQPSVVLVYAGDNDLAEGVSPDQISQDFQLLVRCIHQKLPKTQIIFVSIKPAPRRWSLFPKQKEANALVKAVCAQDTRLHYLDLVPDMIGSDGQPRHDLFRGDGLHLNDKGYALWAAKIKPVLDRLHHP